MGKALILKTLMIFFRSRQNPLKKKREEEEQQQFEKEHQEALKLYFEGGGRELTEDDKFLREYIGSQLWKKTDTEGMPVYKEMIDNDMPDISEDEEELDAQD